MINYNEMIKSIFWEYNFTKEDILEIARSKDEKKKSFLFEKILLNSKNLLNDLEIFSNKDLKFLLENYKILRFNEGFAKRRKEIAQCYFFDKPITISELKWIA
ncbi:MAG: hypothetical protein QM482_00580 [Sulfurospirillum sp.]